MALIRHKRYSLFAFLLVFLNIMLLNCARSRHPNIVIIVADSLRPDHLACYGYDLETSYIDFIASDSVLYTNAFSVCHFTKGSAASLFTSLYPSVHKTNNPELILIDEHLTLAEILKKNGYRTIGLLDNAQLYKEFNFHQGFDIYINESIEWEQYITKSLYKFPPDTCIYTLNDKAEKVMSGKIDAKVIFEKAKELIESLNHNRPYFMYIHLLYPHGPYINRNPGYNCEQEIMTINGHPKCYPLDSTSIEEFTSKLKKLYDNELIYFDKELGKFYFFLKEKGLLNNMLFIFTSDHGEAFGEHGTFWHTIRYNEENIHIPLIIKYPNYLNFARGVREDRLVENIDIAPTILNVAGIKIPDVFQGKSLLNKVRKKYIFAEHGRTKEITPWVLRTNEYKLIQWGEETELHMDNPIPLVREGVELYDLKNDPLEKTNVVTRNIEIAMKLSSILHQHINENIKLSERFPYTSKQNIQNETVKKLRTLGYIK